MFALLWLSREPHQPRLRPISILTPSSSALSMSCRVFCGHDSIRFDSNIPICKFFQSGSRASAQVQFGGAAVGASGNGGGGQTAVA